VLVASRSLVAHTRLHGAGRTAVELDGEESHTGEDAEALDEAPAPKW